MTDDTTARPEPAKDAPQEPESETIPEPPGEGWIKDYNPFEPEKDEGAQERFERMLGE